MSRIGEIVLQKLSRDIDAGDHVNKKYEQKHREVDLYISVLQENFPDLKRLISGKRVLDIGCAEGMESLALSLLGAAEVRGIDIRIDAEKHKEIMEAHPGREIMISVMDAEKTSFPDGYFDVIVTCGSMEHFKNPRLILRECKRLLKDNGLIFLTSGVWGHPWGAHMDFFTKVPWVQFVFSEKTIMNVRKRYRDDGAVKFDQVEGGLNKIGIGEFKDIVEDLELSYEYLKLRPVKGLKLLTEIPYVNEYFTNVIIAILRK